MGQRQNRFENRTAKLKVKRETLRALQTLDADDLRAVAGGMWTTGGTTRVCLPSCNGC